MYHRIQAYFQGIKPVWIDGTFYVLLALFGSIELTFNNDDIYKYVGAVQVFWIKNVLAWMLATVTALKMFRSTTYADHVNEKDAAKALAAGSSKVETTTTNTKVEETKVDTNEKTPNDK